MQPAQCILFSGAAQGAEAAFGAAAERHGLEEVHFTFEGHNATRTRGMRVLTQAELQQGDVSLAYVSRLMHRTFRDTPLFRKVLAVHLAPSQPWPGNLCRGADPGGWDGQGGHGVGRRVRQAVQQAAVRLCPRPGALVPLDGGGVGGGRRPTDHPPPVHRHRHAFFAGERAAGHQRAVRALVSLAWTGPWRWGRVPVTGATHGGPVDHASLPPCPQWGAGPWLHGVTYGSWRPVGSGMARHHRRSWRSRSRQDDQRPPPPSGAAVVAQHGVLLPMHLRRQGAEGLTIDLA